MEYGIWTLIPVLFVIAFALKTKRTLEPLIFGTLLTYVITSAARIPSEGVYALSHIATDWMDAFFRVATDYSHQWVFLVCALFGSLITLLGESHGTLGFTRALGKLCRGPRSTMMVTWIMGILIFVDDYLNIMTLSTCMKKLTDQRRVPREALSYIIDSTGAPVCAILPFSTWAIFFSGLFSRSRDCGAGLWNGDRDILSRDPLCLLRHRSGYHRAAVYRWRCSQAGADADRLPPPSGDRQGLFAGERTAQRGG